MHLNKRLEDAIINDTLQWQAKWTHAFEVRERAIIEESEKRVGGRQEPEVQGGSWVLQEEHGKFLGAEKRLMRSIEPSISP